MNDFNGTLIRTMGEEETPRTKENNEGRRQLSPSKDKQEEEEEEEESTESEEDDMVDLVNGPNPWLPAYGFQLQRHSQFQNVQEELRANDSTLVQQVDFLETILEETSDDLQTDSDRSATTRWLGSDSETESVIHIRTKQTTPEQERDEESDGNAMVPKKKRRRDNHSYNDSISPKSSRSSRSSASSRSSSLLQFECLERTCATVSSPSGYSYDSLEYSNPRSNTGNASPDSLETQDFDFIHNFTTIRACRSFESLDATNLVDDPGESLYSNQLQSWYSNGRRRRRRPRRQHQRSRQYWLEIEDEDSETEREEEEEEREQQQQQQTPTRSPFSNSMLVFDQTNYGNSIDLREIGIEPAYDSIMSSSMSLTDRRNNIYDILIKNRVGVNTLVEYSDEKLRTERSEEEFNFRYYTDKSQSLPSLRVSRFNVDVSSSHVGDNQKSYSFLTRNNYFNDSLTTTSVPIDLNLCCETTMDNQNNEMADEGVLEQGQVTDDKEEFLKLVASSVRTQSSQNSRMDVDLPRTKMEANYPELKAAKTVKIQDRAFYETEEASIQRRLRRQVRNNASYELAQQFQFDERNLYKDVLTSFKEEDEQLKTCPGTSRSGSFKSRAMNNASYELAQQSDYLKRKEEEEEEEEKNEENVQAAHEIEEESLFDQIKKNSVIFSIYGEGGSYNNNDNSNNNNSHDNIKKSFIGEFYPENSCRLLKTDTSEKEEKEEEEEEEGDYYLSPLESTESGNDMPTPAATAIPQQQQYSLFDDKQQTNKEHTCSTPRTDMNNKLLPPVVPQERKKTGLGGFLQRFSKLRFSGRSKVPRSEHNNDRKNRKDVKSVDVVDNKNLNKEPDYVIIPLHPPDEDKKPLEDCHLQRSCSSVSWNGRAPVCSGKPPLPPQPSGRYGSSLTSYHSHPNQHHNHGKSCAASSASGSRRRATTDLGNPADIEMAKIRVMQAAQERPVGLLETDLDELATTTSLSSSSSNNHNRRNVNNNNHHPKTRSLLDLNHTNVAGNVCTLHHHHHRQGDVDNTLDVPGSPISSSERDDKSTSNVDRRPHKSMEFLLDKENLHFVKPPENELQKVGERVPSEHELRVQRSLQRLNVPDWYKNSPTARDGFRLKRHSDASQHGGWRALSSKTTSLSSLSSSSNKQQTNTSILLSPSPTPPVFSRWSTSLLNSAGSSPANSARSSFNHRQPYLGWRSQERLSNPRTPAERLAQGILPQLQAQKQRQEQDRPTNQLEVRNSIKEVTSAIVHYVQSGHEEVGDSGRLSPRSRLEDWDERGGARSTSPRGGGKLCWMESSFVGIKPVDSPETPMSIVTDPGESCPECNAPGTESCSCADSATSGLYLDLSPMKDDTQLSQLQLETSGDNFNHRRRQQQQNHHHLSSHHRQKQRPHSRESAKSVQELSVPEDPGTTTRSHHRSRHRHQHQPPQPRELLTRRKSEGSDTRPNQSPTSSNVLRLRRVSFDNVNDFNGTGSLDKSIRCRNNKCTNSTSLAEARKTYKSCHNCTCFYCSRECRKAHWQRHRRTCLHSRAGTLCRQVLSSAKEDATTLKHTSNLAKRGYASHGRGTVKCFFTSPETAEKFVANGFGELGEPTYVRCSDLLPSEMGTELYTEIMRLCKSYNPETRMVLYVAICVVSEVPTSGAVRWERQLVSRCAKIKLDESCRARKQLTTPTTTGMQSSAACNITREMDSPETLVLTSLPGHDGRTTCQKAREIGFDNIQRQLKLRGVSLRRQFPMVFKKLCAYVDGTVDKFAPVTIYPRDQASGKSFMCIIMLDAEPERLRLFPTDSSRVRTVDISVEQE